LYHSTLRTAYPRETMAFRSLLVILALPVSARLGEPAANESSQANSSQAEAALSELSELNMSFVQTSTSKTRGYAHFATSTVYGDSTKAACGGLHTAELVKGTPYHNVASAQSMWLNCQNHGNCWCGASGGGSGTQGMGCFTCAKGRFLSSRYGARSGGFASKEIVVVVGDLCPYLGNEKWCPEKAGQRNTYGSLNHFDFSHPPAGINNNDFVFTPISCPADLRARYNQVSQCSR